jgi:hypothetical protein
MLDKPMHDGQIFNAMVAFFEDDDWNFQWVDGTSVLTMGFTGRSGKWMCFAQAREEQHQFVYYSVCPLNVPRDRLAAAAEFVTRANYGMIIGNFELDYTDGEIRYKTSIDVEGDSLSAPLVKQLVYANVLIMDRYLPGLMRVIYGDSTPLEEIERIEAGRHEDFGDGGEGLDEDYDDDDLDDDDDDLDQDLIDDLNRFRDSLPPDFGDELDEDPDDDDQPPGNGGRRPFIPPDDIGLN